MGSKHTYPQATVSLQGLAVDPTFLNFFDDFLVNLAKMASGVIFGLGRNYQLRAEHSVWIDSGWTYSLRKV